jgi:hypothetical protein
MEFDQIWIKQHTHRRKVGTKQTVPQDQLMPTWTAISNYVAIWSVYWKIFIPTSLDTKMMHLVSIMQQMTNDADRTQPSPIQHYISMREESILIGFTWTTWRSSREYTCLLVNATMIALFACWGLKQNGNEEPTLTTTNHGQKHLSSLTTIRSSTTYWILLKIGHASITNVISNTYPTISVSPYWELNASSKS